MSQRAAKIMALTAAINSDKNNDTPDGNQGIGNIINSKAHSILDEPSSTSLSVEESIDQLKIIVDDIPVIFEDINLTTHSSVEYVMVHQESARKPDDRENEKGKNDVEKYTTVEVNQNHYGRLELDNTSFLISGRGVTKLLYERGGK